MKLIKTTLPAVILIILPLLSSCGRESAGIIIKNNVAARNTITSAGEDRSCHFPENRESFVNSGVSSGFIELRLDEKTNSFGIFDSSAETLWTALPLKTEMGSVNASDSSIITLKVSGGTDTYILNSQDNSVAYGTAAMKKTDNGCVLSYDMFTSPEIASKKTYSPDDIGFRADVSVTLTDGSVRVGCKWENLTGNSDAFIESIDLLNYFGAYINSEKNNFLFVPDGCGAVINTAVFDESFEALSFAVYGNDPATGAEYSGSAAIPSFGIKRGNAAFATLIEKGDAVSVINADKATGVTTCNRVWPSFTITPVSYKNNTLYISKNQTAGEVGLCYRFLSGVNASYSGMASAVREQLIRNGVLSSQKGKATDDIPFFVTLTGMGKKSVASLEYMSVLTDFDEAQDMLVRMKNKGINNINVRYRAAKTGGIDAVDVRNSRYLSKLGGSRGFASLYEYISSQNMGLFVDTDLLSSSKDLKRNAAADIYGEKLSFNVHDSIIQSMGSSVKPRCLRKVSEIKNAVISILSDSSGNRTGICLSNSDGMLYSDFSQGGILREQASDIIADTISPLSTSNKVMIDGGNFYKLKNADSIINLPLGTNIAKSGAYTPVPFLQLILHGISDYSGTPVNEAENINEEMLRCIEYGACPHYKWNYTPISGVGENDIYYYDNTINSAVEFYIRANLALSDIMKARMTDHYKVSDGVYCTEFDTGAMIYVNYTDKDVSVKGIVVESGDFLRVN